MVIKNKTLRRKSRKSRKRKSRNRKKQYIKKQKILKNIKNKKQFGGSLLETEMASGDKLIIGITRIDKNNRIYPSQEKKDKEEGEILSDWTKNTIYFQVNQDPNYSGGGVVQQEHIDVQLGDNQTDRLIFHGAVFVGYENNSGKLPISGYWGARASPLRNKLITKTGEGIGVEIGDNVSEVLINLGIPRCYTGQYNGDLAQPEIQKIGQHRAQKTEIFTYDSWRIACHVDEVTFVEQLPDQDDTDWESLLINTHYLLGLPRSRGFRGQHQSLYTEIVGRASGAEYPVLGRR